MNEVHAAEERVRSEKHRSLCAQLRELYSDKEEVLDRIDRISAGSGSLETYKLMMEIFTP